jgi:ribose transport system substrate-binding protein
MSEQTMNRRVVLKGSLGVAAGLTAAVNLYINRSGAQTTPANLKIGWSTIYMTPSWMKDTSQEIDAEIERLKGTGLQI